MATTAARRDEVNAYIERHAGDEAATARARQALAIYEREVKRGMIERKRLTGREAVEALMRACEPTAEELADEVATMPIEQAQAELAAAGIDLTDATSLLNKRMADFRAQRNETRDEKRP